MCVSLFHFEVATDTLYVSLVLFEVATDTLYASLYLFEVATDTLLRLFVDLFEAAVDTRRDGPKPCVAVDRLLIRLLI